MNLAAFPKHYWASFSFVGLAVATLFFAASLTPSLLPRHFAVQGVLSGFALAVGYGVGVLFVWVWLFLEFPRPNLTLERASKWITTVVVLLIAGLFLWRDQIWQNSIRELMEMEPVESGYPWQVAIIALVVGAILIAATRTISRLWSYVARKISFLVPRRVAYVLSALVVAVGLFMIANKVVVRSALDVADGIFLEMDKYVPEGMEQPTHADASGSEKSLVAWDTIGKQGKDFIVLGPTQDQVSEFWGKESKRPLRVYVGLGSRETPEERAKLALEELKRVGGFDRKILVVATPTGTGWLDPGAVDTFEYLHAGDTAIVSMQYSYLPSWMTILVDPRRSRESARYLFDEIYGYWTTLPKDRRPKLYLHGLSLGSLGSEDSGDLFTVFEDPIQGGLWSGPPFPSSLWTRLTKYRNSGTPMWLPKYRDGSMVRFTGRECGANLEGTRWGPMRFVYLQHASDPMCFFSPDLLYQRPDWLESPRGADVSPYLQWYPIVTFLQTGFDLPMATSVPFGYGHNYAAYSYIDAWIAVTDPADWNAERTGRLKELFADKDAEEKEEK